MPRISLFNSPFLLGFDAVERTLDRVAKTAQDGYPPYNIEQRDADTLRITVAVAGFRPDELDITIENNEMVLRGKHKDENEDRVFLHRGIATRKFQRRFVLADGIEILDAAYDNGLLHIDLARPQAESRVRKVAIREDRATPSQTVNVKAEKTDA